jgi:hypothetical protein
MGQGVRAAGGGAEEGDAFGARKPAGGAATRPTAVRARSQGGLSAAGTEVPGWGILVYLRRQRSDSTDVSVSRGAYKVHQVRANGRMVLQGAGGTLFKEHLENCAPCHNPNIDLTVDPTLTTVAADHPCQVCTSPGDPERMLLCDYCLEGWYMGCLEPALTSMPAAHTAWRRNRRGRSNSLRPRRPWPASGGEANGPIQVSSTSPFIPHGQ